MKGPDDGSPKGQLGRVRPGPPPPLCTICGGPVRPRGHSVVYVLTCLYPNGVLLRFYFGIKKDSSCVALV
ncbi:hypothetical protein JTE90_015909 [Oedothorax gibbosus]|uniref:Uncharacterized protein n=1 Tax=Oedothorax gibbosus TaxID=931172 RepID=A0AAV6VV08_9ARAC|nr:hypothetical protein JTE90_015909 [Oedothorax gibbosus]